MRGQSGFAPLRGDDFPKPLSSNVWSKFIMSFLGRLSNSSSQNFACSRRELPGKLFVIGAALLLPASVKKVSVIQTQEQPKFKIGDLIASDWVDEFSQDMTDFGEILGSRYLPEGYSCYSAHSWLYYIRWTHSTCGLDYLYPCYDGEPSRECDLRLAKQS